MSEVFMIKQTFWSNDEFYCGKTYVVQGERYGVFSSHNEDGKGYKTKPLAERALETLKLSLNNLHGDCEIVAVTL